MTEMSNLIAPDVKLRTKIIQWIGVAFLVYLLIMAEGMIRASFKSATEGDAKALFLQQTLLWGLLLEF